MKLFKILAAVLCTILVLLVATSAVVSYFLDFDKHLPTIEQQLESKTGLDWTIKGPIKVSVFPALNISVQGLSAKDEGNAKLPALREQDFAFEKAAARVSWFPHIMKKELIVKEVSLINLDYAKTLPDGAKLKAAIENFAVQGIWLGLNSSETGGVSFKPADEKQGLGIAVKMRSEQHGKTNQLMNAVAMDFAAKMDVKTQEGSNGFGDLLLKNSKLNMNIKLPNLKDQGVDVQVVSDIKLNANVKRADLSNLVITAAKQTVKGQANIGFTSVPDIGFNLNGKDIDAGAFMALMRPKGEVEKVKKAPKPLPKIKVDGQLVLDNVSVNNVTINQIDMKVKGQDGIFNITPLKLALYDGSANVKARIDGRAVPAKCDVDLDVQSIKLGAALKDIAKQDVFDGTLATKGDLAVPCLAGPLDLSKLKGTLNANIGNGVIQKWGASKALNKALAIAKSIEDGSLTDLASVQNALNVREGDDRFEFTEMVADVNFLNGIANNTRFNMQAPLSEVIGNGQVDLVKQLIDYNVKLNLSKTKDNNTNYIPVKISGPLTKPSYKIDTQDLFKSQVKAKVQEKIQEKIQDEIGDKIGGEILKALPF